MKEFERHWKSGMLSGSPTSFGKPSNEIIAKFAWKAALKWALQSMCDCGGPEFILNGIEGELDDD